MCMKIKYLQSQDIRVRQINEMILEHFPGLLEETHPDLIVVAGGDGALLHAIQQWNHLQVPFFGYAAGTLNFLMNKIEDFEGYLRGLSEGRLKLHTLETTAIKAEFISGDQRRIVGQAINEVVLGTSIMGYHHFVLSSKDNSFDNFEVKGSGICIASDLGSTGYNFNANGAVLPIACQLWSIKGVVCNRYLDDIIHIQEIQIRNNSTRSKPQLFLDGIDKEVSLKQGDALLLSAGDVIKIAFSDNDSFLRKRTEIASRYRQ